MNDPVANTQLELACRLGLLDDVLEALEDGADIDCNGCSPVFFAIENGDRAIISALVERGADVSIFEVDPGGDVVEQLLAISPGSSAAADGDGGGEAAVEMAELDAKMIRAFERMVRNKGIAEPVLKGRWGEFPAFCDALQSLAAEECQAIASEFVALVKAGQEEADEEVAKAFVAAAENADALADLGARYLVATEDEQPGELLKEYLKERKKLNK